jgi:hypothetical protein
VRVGDRQARLLDPTVASYKALWWSVGSHTSGLAECEGPAEDGVLLELAGLVRYGPAPVRLPFALAGLPAEDEVRLIFDYADGSGALVTPRGQIDQSPNTVYVSVPSLFEAPRHPPTGTLAVDGTTGKVYSDSEGQSVCWKADHKTACVGAYPLENPTARQRAHVLDHVKSTARLLHVARDLDDRATWFDAEDALPH